jgi:predicted permease
MAETLAIALVPIFFGLLLGYFAGASKIIDNVNLRTLMSFVMNFALPCALFLSIVKVPRAVLWSHGQTVWILAVVYLLIFAATYFYGRRLPGTTPQDASVLAMTVGFPNLTAVGIPLLDAVYGPQTGILIAIGLAVGTLTITLIGLAILEDGTPGGHARTPFKRVRIAFLGAVRRPVIWAPAAGLAAVLCNLTIPVYVVRSLSLMGVATAGGSLFLTGLIFSAHRFSLTWSVLLGAITKNLAQPALCLGIAWAVAMPLDLLRPLVLVAAIPSGFFGIVFGKGFDATPPEASSSLVLSYIVSIISLPGWIVLLGHLHY